MNRELNLPEVWMRGPLPGITPLLQPVAYALLQASEETGAIMDGFPQAKLWTKVAGVASPAFHLQHMAGVLDRLFTYAKAEPLTGAQLNYLACEGKINDQLTVGQLTDYFDAAVDKAISQIKQIDVNTITEFRGVGRKQLPSTVIGLLVHAAEHTMRHTGQLLVTVNVLKAGL